MVKKFFSILLAGTIIFSLSACGKTSTEENTDEETGKTLVAYFSWSGNTKEMASYIAEQTGGDVFEIQPATPYPEDYQETGDIAKEERDNNARPEVLNMPEDLNDYDTLFIGYPIWWGIAAWTVDNFVKSNDFTDKNVIPFCTSASSGMGDSGELLEEMAGTGNWQEGERFRSGASDSDVTEWVDSLGL